MRVAAIDIGTNSMRLLVVDADTGEMDRRQQVTGLGRGVDATGRLDEEAMERTVTVLEGYGTIMAELGVDRARAVATSACRDAANRQEFFDRAEAALGVRPQLISGVEEAALSYRGATSDAPGPGPFLVVDIGGGSTEFVWEASEGVVGESVQVGSVRLTERLLPTRPATFDDLVTAGRHTEGLFAQVRLPEGDHRMIGVAGTWTSLAAISLDLAAYDPERVHHSVLTRTDVERLVERLAALTVEETAAIPALDPARAPVILAGGVIAREAMRRAGTSDVLVSEHDLLDGVAAALLDGSSLA